jgi:hypothetical protein
MSTDDQARRIAEATRIASELRDLVLAEAERGFRLAWYDQLRRIVDILTTDDDPAEVLKYAALSYDRLVSGPRNFGDFIISRTDPDELAARNRERVRMTDELGRLLHGR